MSKQDDQKLEKLIAEVFFQAKRKSVTPRTVRLNSIIKRGRYETASKDLLIMSSHQTTGMLMMLSLLIKIFSSSKK